MVKPPWRSDISAGFDLTLELRMAKETNHITPVERVVEEWLRQDFQTEPGREFGVTLGRLKRQLSQRPVGILIDNLEPALDPQGQLLEPHRRYVELLSLLADPQVQATTLITSRDRLCEPRVKVHHYRLPGLTVAAWQQYFQTQALTLAAAPLIELHQTYGGNAKAMEIVCGTVQSDFAGDLADYWQIHQTDPLVETDLKNLIVHQVDRLRSLDPIAYRGFCRLGCYRYQTIPELPIAALCAQLWDVPTAQQRQVIASLRNRSLLENRQGGYWLHPVVRAVAVERLHACGDWQLAHQAAADYWTRSLPQVETLDDALQALEAYYHYCDIQDYEAAAGVLLKSRPNQWQQHLPLTSSLYRMGLLQPVISALTTILPMLGDSSQRWELNNLLGDVYWITGQIRAAIAGQEQTRVGTGAALQTEHDPHTQYYLTMLNVDSSLSLGLYHIDLWELKTAQHYFEQVIALVAHSPHAAWAEKAAVALALVHSYQGHRSAAKALADSLIDTFIQPTTPERSGRFAYFIQLLGQTYSNLGECDRAIELYHQAITFAESSHYVQVKAKALTGLAAIYRQQCQLETAQTYHQQAIDLLEAIGAQCDLAEAYYQLSLTDMAGAAAELARYHADQAMTLFRQIEAPRQIQKVVDHFPYSQH